jgi:2-polyprenyl-3-methyl-5-hydroxy-6-metoxy-1,4-benzoquinol methylase
MAGARRPTSSTALLSDAEQGGASGDYAVMAEFVSDVGELVVERAGVRADSEVLDVVAGTGNASIPAGAAGAHVIATDLTPELFTDGRRRAPSKRV